MMVGEHALYYLSEESIINISKYNGLPARGESCRR